MFGSSLCSAEAFLVNLPEGAVQAIANRPDPALDNISYCDIIIAIWHITLDIYS
jgi:hypothetical protein